MGRKFKTTGTVTLSNSGDTTLINIPLPAATSEGTPQEHFIQKLWMERTDTATAVTLTFKNSADTPRVLLPEVTLNNDQGKFWWDFVASGGIGVGQNLALVVNASVGNKAKVYVEYTTGDNVDWPS